MERYIWAREPVAFIDHNLSEPYFRIVFHVLAGACAMHLGLIL
jgi:hypothetical protein